MKLQTKIQFLSIQTHLTTVIEQSKTMPSSCWLCIGYTFEAICQYASKFPLQLINCGVLFCHTVAFFFSSGLQSLYLTTIYRREGGRNYLNSFICMLLNLSALNFNSCCFAICYELHSYVLYSMLWGHGWLVCVTTIEQSLKKT